VVNHSNLYLHCTKLFFFDYINSRVVQVVYELLDARIYVVSMSVYKGDTKADRTLVSIYNVTIAGVKRSLITDWQYKSDIVIQLIWTVTNLVAYGFLGLSVGQGTGDFAPAYSFSLFLLSSSAFWTMFTGNYEETAFCLREECARGTMGYLITNNVDTLGIMVGRYISSSLKFFVIFLVTTIPTFALVKSETYGNLLPHSASEFFLLVPLVLLSYLFMLGISLFMGSITLLVKQTTTIVRIMLYLVRIVGGYFFMIESFSGMGAWWFPVVFVCLPIVSGQYAFRKYLIEHNTAARFPDIVMIEDYLGADLTFQGFTYGQIILINIGVCIVLLVAAYFFVRWMTKVARRRGTIEFY